MAHIEDHGDGFRVVCPHKRDVMLEFKDKLYPDPDLDSPVGESAWIVGDSPAECQDLIRWADKHGLTWSPSARTHVETVLANQQTDEQDISDDLGGELWPHQVEGVHHLLDEQKTLLTDEMGLGKTITVLAAMETAELYPSLIVTTASATHNWLEEVHTWLPGTRSVGLVDGEDYTFPDRDLYVTSWDLLRSHKQRLRSMDLDCVTLDESHKVRNADTKRAQAAEDAVRGVPYRWGLTGMPIVNYVRDLTQQLTVIDRIDDFGGPWMFKKRYTAAKKVRVGWNSKRHEPEYAWDTTGASNLDDLRKRLKNTGAMLRRRKDEIDELDLPDKRIAHRIVPLDGEDRERYDQAKDAYENADDGDVLKHLNELRQAAARAKLPAAKEWVEQRVSDDEQVVVFTFHDFVMDALLDEFDNALHVRGGDRSSRRQDRIQQFQNGEADIIVCNIKAAGEAITLTAAHEVLFSELWWASSAHSQSLSRVHRIGQDKDVTGWFLIAEDTIDEAMWRTVEKKRLVSQRAIEDPQGRKEAFVDKVRREV